MAERLIDTSQLTAEANAIRAKGITGQIEYKSNGFADAIMAIETGVQAELETLNVTSNGTYIPSLGYDGFDKVIVNTPSNMFNGVTLKDGYFTVSGTISVVTANAEKYVDEYIEFTEPVIWVGVFPRNEAWIGVAIYDTNRNFVRRVGSTVSCQNFNGMYLCTYMIQPQNGEKYYRPSFRTLGGCQVGLYLLSGFLNV